jgi:hypothetical protein
MSDRCLDDQVSAIDLSANVNEFFAEVVHSTIEHRGYEATDAAAKYVVGMLADYTRPGQLGEETLSRPLTLLLDEAMKSSGHERFEKLRTLGDGVLYVSGFFGEHLTNRGVESRYVSTLGARAYETAAAMLRRHESGANAPDVFKELAGKFRMFVQLLSDVSDDLNVRSARTEGALVKLYERWLRTGSDALGDALAVHGFVPTCGNGMVH